MTIGIYKIENTINRKKYFGQSLNVERRIRDHKSAFRGGYHYNEHLQNSFNKYGEENFSFKIVEECELEELDDLEIYYISFYESMNPEFGYNLESGGNENKEVSDETRAKQSEALSGEKNPNYGKYGEEHPRSKYTIWDTAKCTYYKGKMFRNKRDGSEPAHCFRTTYNTKQLPIGYNMDFISCEIIHDLIVNALQDKN